MRRVRNQKIRSGNPGLMFAAGIEQIISDHMSYQSSYEHRQTVESKPVVTKRELQGNFFCALLRQFSY